jgi:hypothetical protein
MSTATVNRSRASLRKLAATHGWAAFVNASGTQDTFVRDGRRVSTQWAARGWFDAPAGRFYTATLIAHRGADIESGNVADVRAWLTAA